MTKFNPERCDAILSSIADNVPNKYAIKAAGICEEKFYKWINQGEEDLKNDRDTPKARFCIAFRKIEHDTMRQQLIAISQTPQRWQAHAWILERRWWREFSPNGPLKELAKKIDRLELSTVLKEELHAEVKSCKKEQTPKE
jgi:hypothetical protein